MESMKGCPAYTIGQRKGLGISGAAEPLYVLELDHANNRLIVGTAAELGRSGLIADRINWTLDGPPAAGARLSCKIRYKARTVSCAVFSLDGGARTGLF